VDGVNVNGSALIAAASALQSAGGSFAECGQVALDADYGSGVVEAAVAGIRAALARASGAADAGAHSSSSWASTTWTEFSSLDRAAAAAISA